ncbi:ABC transporter permease [Agromyces fucosus]|uniref:Autoinducer 2 import system permease protein LsrC n=1 Tax=Agromyces fucosus TaxID=41985 RepID=A0A4Q2JF71_9MICO|nr:ABC transporter permease [Agromyces fucosus]RXZ46431.1 ABC transporter permease [Agromyces fucosus]
MSARLARLARDQNTILAAVIVAGVIVLTISSSGGFLSPISIETFFQFLAIPIVIGLAQMAALAVNQMNLAVGAIGGFAACSAAVLIADFGVPPWLGGIIAILIGLAAGVLNGLIVVLTQINGFIVTLATMTILSGAQYAIVGTRTITSANWPEIAAIGTARPLGIPLIFWIAVGIAILLSVAYRQTLFARNMLASGGNPLAATLSGISNNRSLVTAHGLSGLLCGVAAFLVLASLPGANKSIGEDWLLSSFAAPIIGGVSLTGGTVAVLGTVLAATIVRLVDSARAQFQLEPSWVNFVIGAVVLGTVALDRVRTRRPATRQRSRRPPPDAPPTAAARAIDPGAPA